MDVYKHQRNAPCERRLSGIQINAASMQASTQELRVNVNVDLGSLRGETK